jgi:hypothetical protein
VAIEFNTRATEKFLIRFCSIDHRAFIDQTISIFQSANLDITSRTSLCRSKWSEEIGRVPHVRQSVHGPKMMAAAHTTALTSDQKVPFRRQAAGYNTHPIGPLNKLSDR